MNAQWLNPRNLRERIMVTGILTLETPTHIGNDASGGLLDMPIHLDAVDGSPLLPGSSLAGAMRNYVRQYNAGLAKTLFGEATSREDGTGVSLSQSIESLLIIDDALGMMPDQKLRVEVRDGVAIDPKSRTADDAKKYDIELLAAGTQFPLSFELCLRANEDQTTLLQAFALALDGLATGQIHLGKRKRRGFGRCRVDGWQVTRFNMQRQDGLLAWLRYDPLAQLVATKAADPQSLAQDIFQELSVSKASVQPYICTVNAYFILDGSLLIRSLPDAIEDADMVHLRSWRENKKARTVEEKRKQQPVLSGTSLAGALRARALRIANTVGKQGEAFIDDLFGYRNKETEEERERIKRGVNPLTASRLWVEETEVKAAEPLVQSRVKIDRFTGGSFPGALFSQEAAWGTDKTRINVKLNLQGADSAVRKDAEIGLLLLLLKDLWTGDLTLGGESSVGRGRLAGEHATVTIGTQDWAFRTDEAGRLRITGGNPADLEQYVQRFLEEVK